MRKVARRSVVPGLALIGALMVAAPLVAQDDSAPARRGVANGSGMDGPTRLTLDRAVDLARGSNPAYRRSVNDLELNDVDTREFWLGFLPHPRITLLSTGMQWNRATIGTDNFGNPISNPELRMIQSARSDQFASLEWELDFADYFLHRITALRGEGRRVETDRAGNELRSRVRGVFLEAQRTLEARKLEERLAAVQEVSRDIAERRFRLAEVDRPDLLGAELDYAEQQNRLEESRAEYSAALLRLRTVVGRPELEALEIEPVPLRVFDPTSLDTESLVAAAVGSGPDVRVASLDVQLADRDISLDRARWLPTLQVRAGTGRRELSRETGAAFMQPIPDGEWDRTIGFTLTFPDLGTYFGRRAAARRKAVEARNARTSLREARLRVEEEVRSLLLELESQYRRLDVQERRAGLARERLELQQEGYRLGQTDYLDLQSSVETAADAERRALEARYAFERALIEVERALGAPLERPTSSPAGR